MTAYYHEQTYRPVDMLLDPHWKQENVTVSGIRLHYTRTGGHKPPLVLLHGFMMYGLTWLRVAKSLQTSYDVIMLDVRGHGHSDGPTTGFTPTILAEDTIEFMHALQLDNPILMGHSNGAVVTALVAARTPVSPRAILLIDPPMASPMSASSPQTNGSFNDWFAGWLVWLKSLQMMTHQERMVSFVSRWPQGQPVPPDEPLWSEEDFSPYVEAHALFNPSVFQQGVTYWSPDDYFATIPHIACPILLMTSSNQKSPSAQAAIETLKTSWQRGEHIHMVGAGHYISHGRSHEAFMQVVHQFLGRL